MLTNKRYERIMGLPEACPLGRKSWRKAETQMSLYKEMYLTLMRAQRDAILILQEAHQKAEEMCISPDVPDHLRVIHSESFQKEEQADTGLTD